MKIPNNERINNKKLITIIKIKMRDTILKSEHTKFNYKIII